MQLEHKHFVQSVNNINVIEVLKKYMAHLESLHIMPTPNTGSPINGQSR